MTSTDYQVFVWPLCCPHSSYINFLHEWLAGQGPVIIGSIKLVKFRIYMFILSLAGGSLGSHTGACIFYSSALG